MHFFQALLQVNTSVFITICHIRSELALKEVSFHAQNLLHASFLNETTVELQQLQCQKVQHSKLQEMQVSKLLMCLNANNNETKLIRK